MTEKTLIKFMRDELSPTEREEVIRWIEASDKNRQRYNILKARKTVAEFNTPHINVNKSYERVLQNTEKRSQTFPVWSRIAAAALVLVTAWFVWDLVVDNSVTDDAIIYSSDEVVRSARRGESERVVLPDGTAVTLNADSRLTWNTDFTDSLREVRLTGEAFFEVVRDTLRPFVVHTGDMNVKVLGTTFNVRSYPEDEHPVTTLVSGSVEVTGRTNRSVRLHPMQTASLDRKEEKIVVKDILETEAAPWREGKLIFRDAPLETVIRDIERRYDVECIVQSTDLNDFLFTGTFDNLTIDEVLRVLKISSDINYKKNGREIELY